MTLQINTVHHSLMKWQPFWIDTHNEDQRCVKPKRSPRGVSGLQPPRTESSSWTLFASPAGVWKIRQFHISLGFYFLEKKKKREAFGNTESTPLMAVTGCIWEQLSPLYWVQDIESFSSICYICCIYVSCSPLEVIKLETLVLICADILPSSTKIGCFSPSAS